MRIPLYQVDAFVTGRKFSGNPAAVCLLPAPADPEWMQQVAMEMNLSETAFLLEQSHGYNLRWFTPAVEVDLCGHATLASAHVLWETGLLKPDEEARFDSKSGLLKAARKGDWIELDFPATPEKPATPPTGLLEALGSLRHTSAGTCLITSSRSARRKLSGTCSRTLQSSGKFRPGV